MIINTRPKNLSKNIIKLSKDLGVDLNNVHLSEIKSLISEEKKIEWEPKLSKLNDPLGGNVKRATDDITGQMSSFDEQIKRLNDRAESKRSRLQNKFAKLDSTMGRLKSQQSYISQQLSAMGGGKKD